MKEHLTRSRDDRMLAGVCGGLAELWDADPSLVRFVWLVLAVVTGGIAIVVYIVMAIVVPEADDVAWMTPPMAGTGPTLGQQAAGQPAGPTVAPGWVMPPDYRAARRAARAARRAERRANGDATLPIVFGGLLVIVGIVFLLREWLPQIDFDWVGPSVLIALGLLLLVSAFRRGDASRPSGSGPSTGSGGL